MSGSLNASSIEAYHRDGFLFPLDVFTTREAAALRAEVEALERDWPAGRLPRPLNQYFRVNGQVVIPLLARVPRHPAIVDAVESLLGPDIMLWSAEFFIKEPGTPKIVSWHQDLTYWGMGETNEEVTAWVALSDVSRASGCMRFVAGSHHQRIAPHRDTFGADNLLSRGQEIAIDVNEDEASFVELRPGEMSLHHGRMFHASGPNRSSDRRIGLAMRYVTPAVRQLVAERDYAMLVRGADRQRNWINIAPPAVPFDAAALALYEEILTAQSAALAAGAEGVVGLYRVAAPA